MSALHTRALTSLTLRSFDRFLSFQMSWSSIILRLAIAILDLISPEQAAVAVFVEQLISINIHFVGSRKLHLPLKCAGIKFDVNVFMFYNKPNLLKHSKEETFFVLCVWMCWGVFVCLFICLFFYFAVIVFDAK